MHTCLYCNAITNKPVLVHIIDIDDKEQDKIIPMCSDYCARTLEEAHDYTQRIEAGDL